jgi:predicted dehydrogenase
MRFLLLGDHPDGVALAEALAREPGQELTAYAGPAHAATRFSQQGLAVRTLRDPETALALVEVDAVLVADELSFRPPMLRRALQSEKHVLCVHPADLSPDIAYEAMMIQQDTRKQLVPLLPEHVTPGMTWLRGQLQSGRLGTLEGVELEQRFPSAGFDPQSKAAVATAWENSPLLVLWDALRQLGGEIQDLSALATSDEILLPNESLTLTGRFTQGALFQVLLRPQASGTAFLRIVVRGSVGQATLYAPQGWFGPCQGIVTLATGEEPVTEIPACSRLEALRSIALSMAEVRSLPVTWTDSTRCLELFDAARRSVKRRRVVPMDYEAMSESGNFKSLMTAFGCLTLFLVIVLFFLTPTFPWSKYLIAPLLILFLVLQVFRWIARDEPPLQQGMPAAPVVEDEQGQT